MCRDLVELAKRAKYKPPAMWVRDDYDFGHYCDTKAFYVQNESNFLKLSIFRRPPFLCVGLIDMFQIQMIIYIGQGCLRGNPNCMTQYSGGKSMKRLSMICMLLAGVFLVTGCAGAEKDIKEEELVGKEEYARVTLFSDVEFWHPPIWDVAEGTISGDISAKTNVVLDVKNIIGDPDKQLSLMLVNDELPDIISVVDDTVTSQLVTSGKVWKIDEFLEKYKPESHLLEDYPADVKYELTKRDGAWYALASHIDSPDARKIWRASDKCYEELSEYGDNKAIIWNKELLGQLELNVEELQTEDEVLAAFEKAKRYSDIIPLLVDGDTYQEHTLAMLANSFGAEYVDKEGNYKDIYLQPEMKDALKFLNTVVQKDYMDIEQMSMANDQIKGLMAGGRVLCFIGNIANTAIDAREWVSSGPVLSSTGKTPVLGKSERATTGWINTFISKDCKEPERIADFINYMTSEEGLLLWCYGEEGVHYVRNEEELIELTQEGRDARNNYTQSGLFAWWMFVNTAWERSVRAPFEEGSVDEASYEINTAYATDPRTVLYDSSLISDLSDSLQQGSAYAQMEENIEGWKKIQIPKVILAENDAAFEQAYQKLIKGLEDAQIYELDKKKNEQYQRNCKEYGRSIEKINE